MAQMDKTQRNAIKQTFKNYRNMTSVIRTVTAVERADVVLAA